MRLIKVMFYITAKEVSEQRYEFEGVEKNHWIEIDLKPEIKSMPKTRRLPKNYVNDLSVNVDGTDKSILGVGWFTPDKIDSAKDILKKKSSEIVSKGLELAKRMESNYQAYLPIIDTI